MFENDLAMLKIQLKIALREKTYFVYTLIVPIFMVFMNKNQNFQDNEALYVYWSYIVVTTVFNGFLLNIVKLREGGFFKTLTYLIGSKHSIILANLLIQVLVIQFEILLFNIVVTLFITHISLISFIYGFLVTFLATLLCSAMLSGILFLRISRGTFNILMALFFTTGIVSLGTRPIGYLNYLLTASNPFQLIYGLYILPGTSSGFILLILVCALGYLLIGWWSFKNISITAHLKG